MNLSRASFLGVAGGSLALGAMTPRRWAELDRPRALVLSGGIAEGVYEAGVIKALLEDGYEFDIICGTSIGALNGSLLAQGQPAELFRIWSEIGHADPPVMKLTDQAQQIYNDAGVLLDESRGTINRITALYRLRKTAGDRGRGFLSIEGIIDPAGAQKVLSALDLTKVKTSFLFATSNVTRGRAEAFFVAGSSSVGLPDFNSISSVPLFTLSPGDVTHRRIYPEAVRASGAFPLAFAPVNLPSFDPIGETHQYLDGGIANNTPIRLARKAGARSAICIFLQSEADVPKPPQDDIGIALNLYTENQQQLLDDELILASEYNQVATAALSAKGKQMFSGPEGTSLPPPMALYQIRPSRQLELDKAGAAFGFDRQDLLDRDFLLGYQDGKNGPQRFVPKRYPFTVRFSAG